MTRTISWQGGWKSEIGSFRNGKSRFELYCSRNPDNGVDPSFPRLSTWKRSTTSSQPPVGEEEDDRKTGSAGVASRRSTMSGATLSPSINSLDAPLNAVELDDKCIDHGMPEDAIIFDMRSMDSKLSTAPTTTNESTAEQTNPTARGKPWVVPHCLQMAKLVVHDRMQWGRGVKWYSRDDRKVPERLSDNAKHPIFLENVGDYLGTLLHYVYERETSVTWTSNILELKDEVGKSATQIMQSLYACKMEKELQEPLKNLATFLDRIEALTKVKQ